MNTEENHKKRRRHSIMSQNKITKFNINENEDINADNNNENNKDSLHKFQRNKKKAAALIDKNSRLPSKLRGIEMRIPVIQETLITQKFGDPDKYY